MTLYMDPSARACGIVIMTDQETIDSAYVFDLKGKDTKGTMPEVSRVITETLRGVLWVLCDPNEKDVRKIVVEWPVGSQSARAAWYLSAVQSTIMTYALENNIEYVGIKENDIKKLVHGRAKKVDKSATIQFVIDNYPKFSYILQGTKPTKEALADTIAVYHAHKQEKLCLVKDEKVEDVSGEQEKVSKRKVRRRNNV